MPLPLAPLAGAALRYAAVTLAVYALLQARAHVRRDQRVEDAMDEMPEGAGISRDADGFRGGVRARRVVRLGTGGPGVALDFAGLARLRMWRV